MFEAYADIVLVIDMLSLVVFCIILSDGQPRNIVDDVSEERDSQYDAMLSKMVGRIQTKPGGKLEMGEVS